MGFAIKKAIYIGVRIAFYLDMNSKSKKKFDEEFSSLFNNDSVVPNYLKREFMQLKSGVLDNENIVVIENHPFETENREKTLQSLENTHFIITDSVRVILHDLLKIFLFDNNLPILLEGPTSTGKTSVVNYLSTLMNQKVVRINNHRDTDIEEYIGKFIPSKTGNIVF